MLLGSYETKLTDKNRIAVPSKLRTELEDNLILARGYEGCVLLLDKARWDQLLGSHR
jgi:MraZ protein